MCALAQETDTGVHVRLEHVIRRMKLNTGDTRKEDIPGLLIVHR